MKKHQILLKAMEMYPFGTKFKSIAHKEECVSNGVFYFSDNDMEDGINYGLLTKVENIGRYVYRSGEWAEIVNPKIAVKVENEKEFKALMKYYDSMEWESKNLIELSFIHKYGWNDVITFHDDFFAHPNVEDNYEIIPFYEFAEQHGIKLPLLVSEDGVVLYEGDIYYCVYLTGGNWELMNNNKERTSVLSEMANVIMMPTHYKAFSTKQAALDWIEAQKPKEKEIWLFDKGQKALITKENIILLRNGSYKIVLRHSDIEDILHAIKSL